MSLTVYLTNETCTHCGRGEEVYEANITHNLYRMATEAGIYEEVWRPDEHGITHAWEIIEPLHKALAELRANPAKYMPLDSPNGWGTYGDFRLWLERYLSACEENPDATIRVSR